MPKNILGVNLFSLEEAAELLEVSRNTLTRYLQKAKVPTTRVGGKKYVTEGDIKDYLLHRSGSSAEGAKESKLEP